MKLLTLLFGAVTAVLLIDLATHIQIDYFDGFKFILQAARLTDSEYSFIRFDFNRPRTLVAIFTLINLVHKGIIGNLPSLEFYKAAMVVISLGFVVAWWFALKKVWSANVAWAATLIFFAQQWLVHYGAMIQSDILAGLTIALLLNC